MLVLKLSRLYLYARVGEPQSLEVKHTKAGGRGRASFSSPPPSALSMQTLFRKYSTQSTTRGTFEDVRIQNHMIDMTEFMSFAKDYNLIEILTMAHLKQIFHSANRGEHADDYRGLLSILEFGDAVEMSVNQALVLHTEIGEPPSDALQHLCQSLHIQANPHPKQRPQQPYIVSAVERTLKPYDDPVSL